MIFKTFDLKFARLVTPQTFYSQFKPLTFVHNPRMCLKRFLFRFWMKSRMSI
jgi:hypothetical protein